MPKNVDGVIDEIDLLVDGVLESGQPMTGADYGDPTYPKCWHCGRHFHGLPVTERIAEMYARGEFDEDYRVDADDSKVLCQGSDFIGPMPAPPAGWWASGYSQYVESFGATGSSPSWLQELIDTTINFYADAMGIPGGLPLLVRGDAGPPLTWTPFDENGQLADLSEFQYLGYVSEDIQ